MPAPSSSDLEAEEANTTASSKGALDKTVAFLLALRSQGICDRRVLSAMEKVRRERFVPARLYDLAHADMSLPLACGQTMAAPSIVASCLTLLNVQPSHRVLEVGTGSGYVTALLQQLADEVISVERYRTLVIAARERLNDERGSKTQILHADGLSLNNSFGRFDRIVMMGTVNSIPTSLLERLNPEGGLVTLLISDGLPRLTHVSFSPGECAQDRVSKIQCRLHKVVSLPPLVRSLSRL